MVFSGYFCPNRKAAWNLKRPMMIYKNNMKHCNLKATYYQPEISNFKVHKIIANNKKTLNFAFLGKLSLDNHTVHDLSFCLRTPLPV